MATDNKIPVESDKTEKRPHPLESLRRQVDRLFEDFDLRHFPFARSSLDVEPFWKRELTISGMPAVDIVEKDGAYELTAELPGMDEKCLEIKLNNGILTLKGEKKEEKEEKGKSFYHVERSYGAFQRTVPLPDGIDLKRVDADFKNGVLTVKLPKTAEAKRSGKKVPIKSTKK